jgi:amino acid transporter
VRLYEKILIPLMFLMFALGAVVIIAGFSSGQQDFAAALLRRDGQIIPTSGPVPFRLPLFFAASALLFASFIGFDSIAQAGGEARNPGRSLPMAIGIAVVTVGTFYVLFTAAVYHAVPWAYIAEEGLSRDLTAPGLLGYLLPAGWTVAIVGGAAVALINDLPAMLLAVSRLIFAWGEDGVFPNSVARVHPKWHTPHLAILLSGTLATLGILGNFLANDFFLGVDILVISMLVNFLLICLSVLVFPHRNPELAGHIRVVKSRKAQVVLGFVGVVMLGGFLVIHVWKDLTTSLRAWYFHSTYIYLIVMALASAIYVREVRKLRRRGVDVKALFSNLPPE